jgi:ketosteroid isomerase-like protein
MDCAAIAREYFESFNRRDWNAARACLHDEYSYSGRNGEPREGPEAGIQNSQFYANAFPGLRLDVRHLHVTDNMAIVEYAATTESEAATRQDDALEPLICAVLEMKDGKIHTEREYWQRSLPDTRASS